MIVETGHFALILALFVAIAQAIVPLVGAQRGDSQWMAMARPGAVVLFLLVATAFLALTWASVANDFSLKVVFENSHSDKPLLYRISGVWGDHEGSMLLWVLILTVYGLAVALFGGNLPAGLRSRALSVQAMISVGFLLFILLTSNPFLRLDPVPIDGRGMNPILQDPGQISLAQSHIRWLTERFPNVTPETIDLTGVFQVFTRAIPDDAGDDLTLANTRARLRMTALYAMATHCKLLVAGTGNKIEDFGVGFFTKYGDGGVDISPIADLLKTEVYEVARRLGILQKIMDVPPTDGLWADSRSDESQIGASYPELEWAMTVGITTKEEEAALTDRQREVLAIYRRFNRANRHKMGPIPICVIPDKLR